MKKKRVFSLVVLVMAIASSASASTQLFFDDFTGTALDTSKWSGFVDEQGYSNLPYVEGGLLHLQGYHTRTDSILAFAAPETGQSVTARASICLSGSTNKFGFALNPNERDGPITGYFFDTLHLDPEVPPEFQGQENYVHVIAWYNPNLENHPEDMGNLLDVEIPVTWGVYHEFAIERTPSEVIFSIDGLDVAHVPDAFAGELPVGVWNDRWDGEMLADWVEVSQVPEPATLLLFAFAWPLGRGLLLRKRKV